MPSSHPTLALAELSPAHFTPLVGAAFRVVYPEHTETLTLEALDTKLKSARPGMLRDPFSLIFKGESTTVMLSQHTHPVEHEALGQIEIFLVPIARNQDGTFQYQAVFT